MPEFRLIHSLADMKAASAQARSAGRTLGFVPTMGALHAGHASLIERSADDNDLTVVSIFVNPIQFGPGEDYQKYPRTLAADSERCRESGAGIVFAPEAKEFYARGFCTFVEVGGMSGTMCGLTRIGHFRGVSTVVTKLLNIVRPNRAYFGRKDAQQLAIIQRMVRDLEMDVEIVPMPIVRESDGLAMSSRNAYLSPEERQRALCLSRGLQAAERLVEGGERTVAAVMEVIAEEILPEEETELEYVAVVDPGTLEDKNRIEGDVLVAVAVRVGTTRLIDNVLLEGIV